MCGRYKQTTKAAELGARFAAVVDAAFAEDAALDRPRFNAAPTQRLPVVRVLDAHRVLRPARWGLIPSWAKDPSLGAKLLNARSETVIEKPAFRDSVRRRRCLVPMDGFYEWKAEGSTKQPYLFSFDGDRPFALAGLWSIWKGPAGPVETFTILTTRANELVAPLHDRMPVILDEKDYDEWLDPACESVALSPLCEPRAWPGLGLRPVSRRLGSVRVDDATLLQPDDGSADGSADSSADGSADGRTVGEGRDGERADAAQATTTPTPSSSRRARTSRPRSKPAQGSLW